ncbi:helicase-related protein, partial [Lacticaseibacillus paracasei]
SSEDRKKILSRFKNGEFLVLNNCGILTTGYDEPTIEVIIVNRATMSLPLWLQMCGRGSRIFPNKKNFMVLDFGKNHDRH